MLKNLDVINQKIIPISSISKTIEKWKFKNQKIVFTNGCFDILHLGHVDYLSKAADLGEKLIVALNSDISVNLIKGNHRPIINEESRASLLASLFFVDAVVLFNEETPYNLIKKIKPNILVKGNDYKVEEIIGHDIIANTNGQVITIPLVKGYSTSLIEKRIIDTNK